MEKELPYLLGNTGTPDQHLVERKFDQSLAGYISKVGEKWQVEHEQNVPEKIRLSSPMLFSSLHEAALFAYMKGRVYQRYVDAKDREPSEDHPGTERVEIRVSPNVGQWPTCPIGQWVALCYKAGETTPVGKHCSPLLADAKRGGLQVAFYLDLLRAEQLWLGEWEHLWDDVVDSDRKEK